MKWEPIETAPKDGTRILVGRARVPILDESGKEIAESPATVGEAWWSDSTAGFAFPSLIELGPTNYKGITHWMPLPEPPEPKP